MRWWMLTNAPSSVFSPFGRKACRCGKRIGARLKKPSRLAFSYASRPTRGEKAFGSALPSNAPRSVGFSLGWRSCHQARRAQMTDEGGRDTNLLGKVTFFPLIRQFSLRSKSHPLRHSRIGTRLKKPSRLAFSCASRPALRLRRGGRLLVGRMQKSNAPRLCSFPY